MTAHGIGALAIAAALGMAMTLPIWVSLAFVGAAILAITGILWAVGASGRARSSGRAPVVLPIPTQRGGVRLARSVE